MLGAVGFEMLLGCRNGVMDLCDVNCGSTCANDIFLLNVLFCRNGSGFRRMRWRRECDSVSGLCGILISFETG